MKYKCLILDHDDTVVNSTATVHFPSFVEYLKIYRPHLADKYTLTDYFEKNFHPGVEWLFLNDVGLSEEEFLAEQDFWAEYVKSHTPKAFSGIKEILARHKAMGGIIAVVSHSYTDYIKRDWQASELPEPDIIFGWDMPRELRKPHPYSVLEIMKKFKLRPEEILVVDDLKPGYDMARAAGVAFAAAGWAYDVPKIEDFMRKNCDFYLKSVSDLAAIL